MNAREQQQQQPTQPTIAGEACVTGSLLSAEFSQAIQKAFDTEKRKKNVVNVTRAYYVYVDLKGGISLDIIERYRLEPFHSFLWDYISINKSDNLSTQLWEICNNALSR